MLHKYLLFFLIVFGIPAIAAGQAETPVPAPAAEETPDQGTAIEGKVNAVFTKLRVATSVEREDLVHELFKLGEEAEPTVYDYLTDRDKSIVIIAIRFLSFIQSEKAKESLLKLTIHPNWEIRAMAVIALGKYSGEDVVKRISDSLFLEKNKSIQEAAAYALCMVHDPAVADVYFRALERFKGKLRDTCLLAFKKYLERQEFAVEIKDCYLKHEKTLPSFVKHETCKRLGDMADRRLLPFFTATLDSPDVDLRALAAIALGKIGDVRAIKTLYPHIEDKAGIVREHVKNSLFKITNFSQWENRFVVEEWMNKNEAVVDSAIVFEEIVEKALSLEPSKWGKLFDEISILVQTEVHAGVFPDFITRCLLSGNLKTNDFAVRCFSRFPERLNSSLQFILRFGATKAVATQEGLFRACELASLISYRYDLVENIPLIINFTAFVETLSQNDSVLVNKPVSYLCLKGMTSADLPPDSRYWKKWWKRNGKKLLAGKGKQVSPNL